MRFWRKDWTKEEAELWTKEDLIAALCLACSFGGIMIGTVYSFLLQVSGFITFIAAIALGILGVMIIAPKMQSISREYEEKQAEYLDNLEKITGWENTNE